MQRRGSKAKEVGGWLDWARFHAHTPLAQAPILIGPASYQVQDMYIMTVPNRAEVA